MEDGGSSLSLPRGFGSAAPLSGPRFPCLRNGEAVFHDLDGPSQQSKPDSHRLGEEGQSGRQNSLGPRSQLLELWSPPPFPVLPPQSQLALRQVQAPEGGSLAAAPGTGRCGGPASKPVGQPPVCGGRPLASRLVQVSRLSLSAGVPRRQLLSTGMRHPNHSISMLFTSTGHHRDLGGMLRIPAEVLWNLQREPLLAGLQRGNKASRE